MTASPPGETGDGVRARLLGHPQASTLAQGLLLDVGAAVAAVAATGLADVHWTRAWWVALGLLVAKTALRAAVSYAARRLVPPTSS
jgi:hypothetical protein